MATDDPTSTECADGGRGRASYPWENLSPEAELAKERQISAMFPWHRMSPEEYMAREGHFIQICSLHRYRISDPNLAEWMRRFGELLTAEEEEMDKYRRQFLTREEYEKVYDYIEAVMKECEVEYQRPAWE